MTTTEQRDMALVLANEQRAAVAELRRRVARERGALEDVLMNPPDVLAQWPVVDVVRMTYSQRSSKALARLGQLAARDRVNLLVPLGMASERTRVWAVEHVAWHWCASSSHARRSICVTDGEPA